MASIFLSFVGSQDPTSVNTNEEGSIVSLTRELKKQQYSIRRFLLLYTEDLTDKAEETKFWLESELKISPDIIEILPVSPEFTQDPVNVLLATQEAHKALNKAKAYMSDQDRLEFNGSSGTPVMKTAWSILQAAGYAPHSSVWQVRNPKQMQDGQARVFQTNLDTVKNEFDFKVVKQQIADYNYSGALVTLADSNLSTGLIVALLQYGKYRLAFDFDKAYNALRQFANDVDSQFLSEIGNLRQKNPWALLKELYFKILINQKNQNFAEFLVDVFRFQEALLKYLVEAKLNFEIPETYGETGMWWNKLKTFDNGSAYRAVENYRFPNGGGKIANLQGFPNRPVMLAILENYQEFAQLLTLVYDLNKYCEDRNRIVHRLEGISELPEADKIVKSIKEILRQKNSFSAKNSFDSLNEVILSRLEQCIRLG
ncbi:MAG TPA: hypothetical protein IGS52_15165 [Oscillatoriaceae cyanobacterium M33_DOE_052]|uniref:CRISPR-associated protein n=1 Tax=Planktothricoides sp. SpSt-374 TaxID=2282167 RepID=A0A7C3ZQ57_9CYAN|nr:hypothetical protein [Oscillatoriaceae cyanobacterium M33_DOE_052]